MYNNIVLLPCSKRKLTQPAKAYQFYQGALFTKAYHYYVRCMHMPTVYILSAKYGLVKPTDMLSPYEMHIRDVNKHSWSARVLEQMEAEGLLEERHTWYILAPKSYYQYITPKMPGTQYYPLRGLGIGLALARLNRLIEGDSTPADHGFEKHQVERI